MTSANAIGDRFSRLVIVKAAARRDGYTKGGVIPSVFCAWKSMLERCLNSKKKNYLDYGGRGITVCDRWLSSFANFVADMGNPPPNTSLDRIDNDGNYEPGNCRWAACVVQNRNKRTNKLLTFRGKTQCLAAWAEEIGKRSDSIAKRLKASWSVGRALSTPIRGKTRQCSK